MEYSILMSVYDKEKPEYLKQAIESMLNQTAKPEQFVIVLDGKLNEGLQTIIDNYKLNNGKLFTIVSLKQNVGLGRALDIGLQHCRNELVARMDSDDISLPERCAKELALFEQDKTLAIVGCNIDEFWDDPTDIKCSRVVPSEPEEIRKRIGRIQPFNHPTVMYKKSKIIECGGYGHTRGNEDRDMFSRLIHSGAKARNINESLLLFRSNADNYKRRKSFTRLKSIYKVTLDIYNRKHCSFFDLLYVLMGQTALFLMPMPLMKLISDKALRKER
ncbi:glycosyltransferase [Ruminococcus sp. XPD3002]|uniref:glycosyltransferase n=1 Tax=Ruminococcus sp. XPD3002 TaxID=1452269 RepID=UPI0009247C1D|nr:Glycosyl transferase family 2 [Ruminococcus flavefaciens]